MKAQRTIQQAIITAVACFLIHFADAQCTPKGNQAVYGTSNTWIGYVYRGSNFDVYKGYVNEGNASSADFDENFGGSQVQYATNGCSAYTDTFSVRYRLTRNFPAGDYIITVGGDDGYRFSTDGGATWSINNWTDHSYATSNATIHLSGTYNLVLEYYERYGDNRISIKIEAPCGNGENTAQYNTTGWTGYVYSGMNFDSYKGSYTEQSNFDENFGGDNVTFNTSGCPINTSNFSVRYRMNRTLAAGTYIFTVGGDDGYRLSLDGGNTYVINKWIDQGYNISSYTAKLAGNYNMVLEYYENGGANRISLNMSMATLPVKLISFNGALNAGSKAELVWKCTDAENFSHFTVQKSADGRNFEDVHSIDAKGDYSDVQTFAYTDAAAVAGAAYYRLAMVDRDGSTDYSAVIVLNAKAGSVPRIYPTIVEGGSIYVETGTAKEQVKMEVYDMNGKLVFAKNLNGGKQQVSLQFNGKAQGAYVARLSSGRENMLTRLIVMK